MAKLSTRLANVRVLLWLALVLALAGSISHVAHVFAMIDGNRVLGWVQAVAVDIGLAGLTLSLMQRRRMQKSAALLIIGLVLFGAISIYANLCYAMQHEYGELPAWMRASMPWVLAAVLPVLVSFLADVLGTGLDAWLRRGEATHKRQESELVPEPVLAIVPMMRRYECPDCEHISMTQPEHAGHRRWCVERAGNGKTN